MPSYKYIWVIVRVIVLLGPPAPLPLHLLNIIVLYEFVKLNNKTSPCFYKLTFEIENRSIFFSRKNTLLKEGRQIGIGH